MVTTIENQPVQINLLSYVNTTGWSLSFGKVIKEKCSAGSVYGRGINLDVAEYQVTYTIESVTGGSIDVFFGGVQIGSHTSAGNFNSTVNAINSEVRMYGDLGTTATVSKFYYMKTDQGQPPEDGVTMAFAEGIDKWTSFYAFSPDYGFSLKRNLFTVKNGSLWKHDVSYERNNIYGIKYDSIIEFPINVALNVVKTFKSIEIQSNKLLVTTEDGIKTSLGQVSDLFEEDFKRYTLNDGVTSVDVYDREGLYIANFLRDKNVDLINGTRLKGDLMTIRLTTTDDKNFKLFSVYVNMDQSSGGS